MPLSIALPPDTVDIAIVATSSSSYIESSVGVPEMVPVVVPALIVIVSPPSEE